MNNKLYYDLHYCRSFTSLLVSLGYIIKHRRKYNILVIPSQAFKSNHINKKVFDSLLPLFDEFFKKIIFVNYERLILKNNSFVAISRSQSVKKNLNQIKIDFSEYSIRNAFCGGDDFESILIKKLGYKPNFYFTEHGWGNLKDSILFKRSFFFKIKFMIRIFIKSFLEKFLFAMNIFFFYPVRYKAYVGVLQEHIKGNIYINDTKKLERFTIDLFPPVRRISNFILKHNLINFDYKQEYVLFNYSSISLSKDIIENQNLFKKFKSIIKKNKILIFKGHPSYSSNHVSNFIDQLNYYLKKNDIKTYEFKKDSLINNLPSQVVVDLLNIKSFISDLSTSIFHISFTFEEIMCYFPFNFSLKNKSDLELRQINNELIDFINKLCDKIKIIA